MNPPEPTKDDLLRRLESLSPEKRALMIRRLSQKSDDAPAIEPLPRTEGDLYSLSSAQQRLWFLEKWEPGNPAYIHLFSFRLIGDLHRDALQRSLDELLRRHEALRTVFVTQKGQPLQRVLPAFAVPLPFDDLSLLSESERASETSRVALEEGRARFDLGSGPLLRARLLKLSEGEHLLLTTLHHIITDGWSTGLFYQELAALYDAFSSGKTSPLTDLTIQYKEFASWQQKCLEGDSLDKDLEYWKEQLSGEIPTLDLPADRPRPLSQTFNGARHTETFPKPLLESLKELSEREGVTPFILLLSAFNVLVYRYTGQEDLLVGTPISHRNRIEIEKLQGFFANTLVLRSDLSGNPPFRDLLRRVKEVSLSAYSHQEAPFERLVEMLQPERDLSRSVLFQVMFQLLNMPDRPIQLPGLAIEGEFVFDNRSSKFDLTLQAALRDEGLYCWCEYNTDLFDPETMARFMGHYRTLLEGIVAYPEDRIGHLPILTERERRQLLVDWNDTALPYTRNQTISRLFEEQARRRPEAIALVCGDQRLTYDELNKRANHLAHHLVEHGVGPETRVGVCVDRSLEMIVGILGVLKAGGAYVPLDPHYPQQRMALILEDAQASVIVVQEKWIDRFSTGEAPVVCLDRDWTEIAKTSGENPEAAPDPNHLAYVIFTSGSTGRPKGVQINHYSVAHLVETTCPRIGAGEEDVWTVFHSFAFDFSVWEIWGALLTGATLVVVPHEVARSPEALYQLLTKNRVTVLNMTPSALRQLIQQKPEVMNEGTPVRVIAVGGEALPPDLAAQLLEGEPAVWNFYGPTEATVWAAFERVTEVPGDGRPMTIGRPLANTQLYVLNPDLELVPVGVPGELHIGGIGVARGYINRSELTAERFVSNSFDPDAGRLYKTGDLVRYLPDGKIEFLGRMDHQVKIRGFRIELGEIEAVLGGHPKLRESLVMVREDRPGDKTLAAYVVPEGEAPSASELRGYLSDKLPDYMVPSAFVVLDAFPLTPNKKIDRKALPAPSFDRPDQDHAFAAPQDSLELQLTQIWENVMEIRPIGRGDNFFDLGGNSLTAVRLFSQIEETFGKELALTTLFQAPTVEQLAEILRQEGWTPPWTSLVALQAGGSRTPFFCSHAAGGSVLFYRDLSKRLGPDQPFYGIQAQRVNNQYLHQTVEEMAAFYIEEVRSLQPEGPYLFGGASYGGVIVFEMAQQLLQQGQEVSLIALFDSYGPGYLTERTDLTSLHRMAYWFVSVYRRLEHHAGGLILMEHERRLPYLKEKYKLAKSEFLEIVEDTFKRIAIKVRRRTGRSLPTSLHLVQRNLIEASKKYQPKVYPGRLTLFRSPNQPLGIVPDPTLGWGKLAGGELEIIDVPGNHAAMISEPRVRFIAPKLQECLDRAGKEAGDRIEAGASQKERQP